MTMLLKDCPFCGSDQVDVVRTNPNACWIRCANDDCGAEAKSHRTRKGAFENWNRRDGIGLTASIRDDDDKDRWTKAQKRAAA